MQTTHPRTRRWTRVEYDRLIDVGMFQFARTRVPEYWILNLRDRVLEVYREPHPDPSALHGWAYRSPETLAAGDYVTPSATPTARIAVANLLP